MVTKILYLVLSAGSLGVLAFEAPRGALLSGKPESGKVERDLSSRSPATEGSATATIRTPHYVFLGGFHGGK
jgi:hypothetical protein